MRSSNGLTRLFTTVAMPLLVLCACASGGASAGGAGRKSFSVSYRPNDAKVTQHFEARDEETWAVLGPAFQDLGYKGRASADTNERLYMTPKLDLKGRLYDGEWNSAYFDCGRAPARLSAADYYELTFVVLVWVEADKPSGSVVRILVSGMGHDRANPTDVVQCGGTGRLEAKFIQAIQRRLNLAAKPSSGM